MTFAQAIADIALGISAEFGDGPFVDAKAHWPGAPVMSGGSIVTPGTPVGMTCSVQVDRATEEMRAQAGFAERDVRLLVLAATLDGVLDTDARVQVLQGPHAGWYSVQSVPDRDPMGVYYECRGRPVKEPG